MWKEGLFLVGETEEDKGFDILHFAIAWTWYRKHIIFIFEKGDREKGKLYIHIGKWKDLFKKLSLGHFYFIIDFFYIPNYIGSTSTIRKKVIQENHL